LPPAGGCYEVKVDPSIAAAYVQFRFVQIDREGSLAFGIQAEIRSKLIERRRLMRATHALIC
jgi:hypothetical protein